MTPGEGLSRQIPTPVVLMLGGIHVDRLVDLPWTVKSACPSPSRLSRRTAIRSATGSLNIVVVTVPPFHLTSRGRPTLTKLHSVSNSLAGKGLRNCRWVHGSVRELSFLLPGPNLPARAIAGGTVEIPEPATSSSRSCRARLVTF